jgi:integrase
MVEVSGSNVVDIKSAHKSPVDKFLDVFSSQNTKRNYQAALFDYFASTYGDPKLAEADQRKAWTKQKAIEYLSEKREYESDINNFVSYMVKLAPKSSRLKVTATKMFLLENGIELSQLFWKRASKHIKGSRALTIDKVPETIELRKMVSHMPIQGKTLVLMLSSSGMRIGEALGLKLANVQVVGDLLRIAIPGPLTKTGNPRVTFASRETKEAFEEWLKVRDQYILSAVGKSHFFEKLKIDDRVFPFEVTTAYRTWANALQKTGLTERDPTTKRRLAHPHVLRKFFRTKLGSVIQSDVVEALMGHEEGLTEVYRKYSEKDMLKMYGEGEHALLLFGEMSGNATQLRAEVNAVYRENFEMRSTFDSLRKENQELKERISRTEQRLTEFDKLKRQTSEELAELKKLIRKPSEEVKT